MYKVGQVTVSGFWGRHIADCSFNQDVNVIIGRNGTGKTTFMNLLHAALTVDLEELGDNEFDEIIISLIDGRKSRAIKVKKLVSSGYPFLTVEYKISNRKYPLRAFAHSDETRIPIGFKKKMLEEASRVKDKLNTLVNLSSLSVYRLKNSEEFEVKDRGGRRLVSPIDFRLMQLRTDITKYQYELSAQARQISLELQKDVLVSILYSDENTSQMLPRHYDVVSEKSNLISAYKRLGTYDTVVHRKISTHVAAIEGAVSAIYHGKPNVDVGEKEFAAIDAFGRTNKIVEMSLKAEERAKEIFSQATLFISILKDFIPDKEFEFNVAELKVFRIGKVKEEIPISKLSSGEKQLIILLSEALLQRGGACVYLADEPELSLHIAWQRMILPAIKKLNPNAQIIAATHSPEVASKYKNNIIDMMSIVNG